MDFQIEFDRRLTRLEAHIDSLAKKVDVQESNNQIDKRLERMETNFKVSSQENTRNFGELSKTLQRLTDMNEENMKIAAHRLQESHARDMAIKDAELQRVNQEKAQMAEDAMWVNQVKEKLLPLLQFLAVLFVVLGIFWALFTFGVRQAHVVPPVKNETSHIAR